MWDGSSCYFSQRFYATACIRAYSIVHGALFFERLYVSIIKQHRYEGLLGGFLVFVVLVSF
jgi:hypothetical protein